MRLVVAAAGLTLLSGCGASASPKQQFDIAMNSGTYADVCAAARELADEALKRGDQREFEYWRVSRDIHCSAAARNPYGEARSRDEDAAAAINNARETYRELQNSEYPGVRETARELEQQLNEATAAGQ